MKKNNVLIEAESSLLEALKKMDDCNVKLLIVTKKEKYFGLVSIGDIQRAILQKKPLDAELTTILRSNFDIAKVGYDIDDVKQRMLKYRAEYMPVIDKEQNIVEVLYWNEIFDIEQKIEVYTFDLPIVIMAGGKGSRLKPITNILPKALIPIGEKTILEKIMDNFLQYNSNRFYMSVNYKADMIIHYFKELDHSKYQIEYFTEDQPLGTAGSLFLLRNKIKETFFVSNCDIIINDDYAAILKYHRDNNNELTIVSALRHYPIPYGIIETGVNGSLENITEKPELTFQINSGMYILEPHLLKEIPENRFFHITHLIENIKKRKGKVGVFPVSEKSWIDIGEWDEYLKNK